MLTKDEVLKCAQDAMKYSMEEGEDFLPWFARRYDATVAEKLRGRVPVRVVIWYDVGDYGTFIPSERYEKEPGDLWLGTIYVPDPRPKAVVGEEVA